MQRFCVHRTDPSKWREFRVVKMRIEDVDGKEKRRVGVLPY